MEFNDDYRRRRHDDRVEEPNRSKKRRRYRRNYGSERLSNTNRYHDQRRLERNESKRSYGSSRYGDRDGRSRSSSRRPRGRYRRASTRSSTSDRFCHRSRSCSLRTRGRSKHTRSSRRSSTPSDRSRHGSRIRSLRPRSRSTHTRRRSSTPLDRSRYERVDRYGNENGKYDCFKDNHQNAYQNYNHAQSHLPHSNLVGSEPFLNSHINPVGMNDSSTINTQQYFPYMPENPLLYSIVYNIVNNILRSGLYAQPIPLDTTKTPTIDTTAEFTPETRARQVAGFDCAAAIPNKNSTENNTYDLGAQEARILDDVVDLFEMQTGGATTSSVLNENQLSNLTMSQASEKNELTTLDSATVMLNDGNNDVSQDDANIENQRIEVSAAVNVQNNDPQLYFRNHGNECKICKTYVRRGSVVNHYVNSHPNSEVFPSRVAPDVGELLRKIKNDSKCEAVIKSPENKNLFRQCCFFCSESMCLSKYDWIYHLRSHTGYYRLKCNVCQSSFKKYSHHVCKPNCSIKELDHPFFDEVNVIGFLCDICNYVRFNKADILKHLKCEHKGDVLHRFQEIIFLSFPGYKKRRKTINQKTRKLYNRGTASETKHGTVNRVELNEGPFKETSEKIAVHKVKPEAQHANNVEEATLPRNNQEKTEHKKLKKSPKTPIENVKNIDKDCHSRNHGTNCKICNANLGGGLLVSHYVNVHSKSEVFPSRVAPDIGDLLRKNCDLKCEAITKSPSNRNIYQNICYFCNKSMCLTKYEWMRHIKLHSGYYRYRCTNCSKKFSIPSKHKCKEECVIKKVSQPQFDNVDLNLMAYICDWCNYVRFDEKAIQMHLKCQHGEDTDKYREVTFLSFSESPKEPKEKLEKPEIAESSKVNGKTVSTNSVPTSTGKSLDESWETYLSEDEMDTGSEIIEFDETQQEN